ncbi:hypothetical protein, partial [Bacteroides acidifaciens]|uniref:hypothetical protein n=1 Tax=Bacteroides acidifaciens TaxID=85831 RepID=UPI0025A647AA
VGLAADNDYFNKFDRTDYKVDDPIDAFQHKNTRDKFKQKLVRERIERERAERLAADNDYFSKFNRDDYKIEDRIDERQQLNTWIKFIQQLDDEHKAYSYFNKYYPEYLDRAEIQDILRDRTKVTKLAHIIDDNASIDGIPKDPENNEIFEYLGEFGHDFKSKHTGFLMVNEPDSYDRAVEAWQKYAKYADSDYSERTDIDTHEPIYIY